MKIRVDEYQMTYLLSRFTLKKRDIYVTNIYIF